MTHRYFRLRLISICRFLQSINFMLYLRMGWMSLTAGIRIRAVYAPLLVVYFSIICSIHWLQRRYLHLCCENLLMHGWFCWHDSGSHRLHFLADGVTKVASRQWHYIFRISELFVFLETWPSKKSRFVEDESP